MTGNEFEEHVLRFRKLPRPVRVVYARPRTFIAFAAGILLLIVLPASLRPVSRLLAGWDGFALLYLVLVYGMILSGGDRHLRYRAAIQDDGRFLILMVTALGAFASIAAIVFELGASQRGAAQLWLATFTIALSWALVHTAFALHYAHEY